MNLKEWRKFHRILKVLTFISIEKSFPWFEGQSRFFAQLLGSGEVGVWVLTGKLKKDFWIFSGVSLRLPNDKVTYNLSKHNYNNPFFALFSISHFQDFTIFNILLTVFASFTRLISCFFFPFILLFLATFGDSFIIGVALGFHRSET